MVLDSGHSILLLLLNTLQGSHFVVGCDIEPQTATLSIAPNCPCYFVHTNTVLSQSMMDYNSLQWCGVIIE